MPSPQREQSGRSSDETTEGNAVALACCLQVEPERARIVRIVDTKYLDQFV